MRGDDLASYRDPDHPTQLAIVSGDRRPRLTSRPGTWPSTAAGHRPTRSRSTAWPGPTAGCPRRRRSPRHSLPTAIRTHPEFVSGTRRDELELIRALPGLIGKAGAEATYAVGLPDGRGVAIKISDGSPRARAVAMAGVLQRLGFDHETLEASRPARRCSATANGSARSDLLRRRWPGWAADRPGSQQSSGAQLGSDVQADLGIDQGLLAGSDAGRPTARRPGPRCA